MECSYARPGRRRWGLALFAASLALAEEAWVRIVMPADGSQVASGGGENSVVDFDVSWGGVNASGIQVCAQLTNKRLSYDSFTHCQAGRQGRSASFELSGMGAGVWRCCAYLRFGYGSVTFSRRGAAVGALAFGFSWFVINRNVWLAGLKPTADSSQAWLALASARRAIDIEGLGARLSKLAGRNRLLVVSMANSPHVDLAINMAYSAMRAGLPPTIIFALSETAEARLTFAGIETARLASNRALDLHKDVQSSGFGAIAAMKAVCVLSVLSAGVDAWWIDTDVVFFDKSFVSKQRLSVDMIFQSGGFEITRGEDHFHVEACTGVYFARARPAVVAFLEAVIIELQLAAELRLDWFGDQAATNLVLFERRFRTLPELNVEYHDPIDAPSGGLFFGGLLMTRERAKANLAHNNFVIGYKAKLDRFEAAGLWFDSSQPRHIKRSLQRAKFVPKHACQLASIIVGGRRPSRRLLLENLGEGHPGRGELVVFAVDNNLCKASTSAIATVSLGDRPWFWPHLAPRLAAYANKIGADFVVQSSPYPVPSAKRYKLDLAASLLVIYRRCLLLDDTVAIRTDSPDLFQFVPPLALGALVEDDRVRKAEENAALLSLARMSYDPTFGLYDYNPTPSPDALWLNSGVLVLSWLHTPLVDAAHFDVDDAALYWDQVHIFGLPASLRHSFATQAFVNAMRAKFNVPVVDLGYEFNYLGSFEAQNRAKAPFDSCDAFFVHGTTGLLMDTHDRTVYFRNITRHWAHIGL